MKDLLDSLALLCVSNMSTIVVHQWARHISYLWRGKQTKACKIHPTWQERMIVYKRHASSLNVLRKIHPIDIKAQQSMSDMHQTFEYSSS